ncbi:hypothetical protein PISMIDRAFT_641169 [Pisolithus microcarpus 441]|uniref:Uncharacterized protein n=1 Tax=Pisolithus microcarpus 441 TaxID=765257 RepID=A0A0C9YYQ8_9AGAM|nr:hypothetical protein PISMIDRAFT_641169 [Pisolithus microcarpus 441]
MDIEGGDIGSATNSGNGGTGNEGTARQKDEATSKAKGKGKAKAQDREEQGQENAPVDKGKGKEKKMTHAIKGVKKTPVQEMIDHIKGLVNQATLGYALMIVVGNNDMGAGPMMQCQQINLHGIDKSFMADFLKGVEVHGLQNRFIEHALDPAVHKADINSSSLQPAQSMEYTNSIKWQENVKSSMSVLYNGNHCFTYMREHSPYRKIFLQHKKAQEEVTQVTSGHMHEAYREAIREAEKHIRAGGVWLVQSLDLDFIQRHEDSALVESHVASNSVLPVHQDSEHDSLQLIMKILLDTSSPEARAKFIQHALKSIQSMNMSHLGKMLRDHTLFNSVFNLSQFNHFHCHDNAGSGLSIQNISTWYPTMGGAMICISDCYYKILYFLAMPVEFNNVPTNTPPQGIEAWFASQYEAVSQGFDKPIQLAACQVLDKSYFKYWADTFANTSDYDKYMCAMSKYWEAVIHHAEMEKEGSLPVLEHGLMAKVHRDKFLSFFPVPGKLLLYALGEQIKSIQPAIKELGVDGISRIYKYIFCACCGAFLGMSNYLEVAKKAPDLQDLQKLSVGTFEVKRSKALVKKLVPLFESYKAHCKLLGTDAAWNVREDLIKILSILAKKGGRGQWLWYDLLVEKPVKEVKDQLDKTEGPMPLNDDESEGNLNARAQQFFQLHECNHNKIQQIIWIALSDELGIGFGGKALPEARKATEGLVKVSMLAQLIDELH